MANFKSTKTKVMKKQMLLTISFLIIGIYANAQRQGYNWYFGTNAHVDFNTNPPSVNATSSMSQREGCASISAPNGNLLFYTNGVDVWDKNNNVMPNGAGIGGSQMAAQSSIIVPVPSQPNQYYIFTVGDWISGPGLSYSLVDMTLNGGLGDLVYAAMSLNANVREQVTSVEGVSGDIWIVSHERGNQDYVVYNISSLGVLNTTPIRTTVGMNYSGGNRFGYLKFSQNGNKFCNTFGSMNAYNGPTVQLLDFNKVTGSVSNPINLGSTSAGDIRFAYSSEFSPDNTKLYVSEFSGDNIYQFDISLGSQGAVYSSRKSVGIGNSRKECLQIGPCNKIYVSGENNSFLGVINSPDNPGASCDFDEQGILLAAGTNARLGLPNFKRSYFDFPSLGQDTLICSGQSLSLNTNMSGASYLWNTGSSQSSINVNQSGQYVVDVMAHSCRYSDTINITVQGAPIVDAGSNQVICDGDNVALTGSGASTYSWDNGATLSSSSSSSPTASPSVTTIYTLTGTDANGCENTDQVTVSVNALPNVSAGPDTSRCLSGNGLELNASGASVYAWSPASLVSSTTVVNPYVAPQSTTTFIVTGQSVNGCINKDSVVVYVNDFQLPFISDTTFCEGSTKSIDLTQYSLQNVTWQPAVNVNSSTYGVFDLSPLSSANYTLTVMDSNGCVDVKHFNVDVVDSLVLNVSSDTFVCPGQEIEVYVNGAVNPVWNTGDTYTNFFTEIYEDTLFYVSDSNLCGKVTESIQISVFDLPNVEAGQDQQIYLGQTTSLDATVSNGLSLDWSPAYYLDNSSIEDPLSEPEQTTDFVLFVTSADGCEARDTVTVYVNEKKDIRIPTIFSPNNDLKNDQYFVSGNGICDLKMTIYNRWGEQIFQGFGPDVYWDGQFNGQEQPIETYAIFLEVAYCDGQFENYNSHFTLVR